MLRFADAQLLLEALGFRIDRVQGRSSVSAWNPVIRGTLGIVQPGLSAQTLRAELNATPAPKGTQSLQELFSVLWDTTVSDGVELVLLVSP
jgi:hypothetical protein